MNEPPDAEAAEDQIDPIEFLKRALAITPEDAAQVREEAAKRAAEGERRGRSASDRPQ